MHVVAILGTGALGCVFAAQLAACADVWMLGTWAEGVAAVQRDGIRITSAMAACGTSVCRRPPIPPMCPRLTGPVAGQELSDRTGGGLGGAR